MTRSQYYVLTLPVSKSETKLNSFVSRGISREDTTRSAQEKPHYRYSNDRTKVLVEAFTTDEIRSYIKMYSTDFLLIGENVDGKVEQSVYDFIEKNKSEWESPQEIMDEYMAHRV